MSKRDPICHECGYACDCGERPHGNKCGSCSICLEMRAIDDEDDGAVVAVQIGNSRLVEMRTYLKCPHCGKRITASDAASALGSVTSDAKAEAARENGKKGGRPPSPKRHKGTAKPPETGA